MDKQLFIAIPHTWFWLCLAFGTVLLIQILKTKYSSNLYTRDGSTRKFSILDLEFPSSPTEISNIIKGIYRLTSDRSLASIKSLKTHLILDLFFMPGLYGTVFLLCMHVSSKTVWIGHPAFALFAWLQGVAWIFDIIENIYLYKKIKPDSLSSSPGIHFLYRYMVIAKWGILLFGGVCSVMVILYFWFTGRFVPENLFYIGILMIELIVFLILNKLLNKK